jgi:lysophospholipase L1-like esterase/chitodextrinase
MTPTKRIVATLIAVGCAGASSIALAAPADFEAEIRAFEAQDAINEPPSGQVVATGSSSIRIWSTIATDLSPLTVIARGFGGSTAADLDYFLDRVVLKYQPRAVLIYEGDNDLGAGIAPADIASTMAHIVSRISARLPDARVYVIAVKPSPWRVGAGQGALIRQVNQLYAAICASDARYNFIDIASPLLAADGTPVASYYQADDYHLNASGYQVWTAAIRSTLIPQQQLPALADTTAPTAPGSVIATAVDPGQVTLRWTASSDSGIGLAGYRIWRNGLPLATTTTATNFTDVGLLQNTAYTYNVSAYDRMEPLTNESVLSEVAFVTTTATAKASVAVASVPAESSNSGGGGAIGWTDLSTLMLLIAVGRAIPKRGRLSKWRARIGEPGK